VGANDGFVAVGIDHDTAAFAVNTIDTWWERVGRIRYPNANRLTITADAAVPTATSYGPGSKVWPRSLPAPASR
jgi:hypothetical protein